MTAGSLGLAAALPRIALAQEGQRSLMVYFSRTGNTQTVVDRIADRIGCEAIEIETQEPYPEHYETLVELVHQQARDNYLPTLANPVDLTGYDRVFVGSPI